MTSAARTFDPSNTPSTTFVLEMIMGLGAEKIASAIAESVSPRYSGDASVVKELESLIVKGVKEIGGTANKGSTFRFDCSEEGVAVSVNGSPQGVAKANELGSAFVDVFMDKDAVSPTLVESCQKTWGSGEGKSLAASLISCSGKGGGNKSVQKTKTPTKKTQKEDEQTRKVYAKLKAVETRNIWGCQFIIQSESHSCE